MEVGLGFTVGHSAVRIGLGRNTGPDGHLSAELSWGKSEAEVGTSRVTLVCQNHGGITVVYAHYLKVKLCKLTSVTSSEDFSMAVIQIRLMLRAV